MEKVAAQEAAPSPLPRHDLGEVQNMDRFIGSESARKLLASNGFVVTDHQFKQIFSAYIDSSCPKFITTDSAWHTYHVVLEAGVLQLEQAQADRLRLFSRRLSEQASKLAADGDEGWGNLATYAAIGLGLQDPDAKPLLPKERGTVVTATLTGLTGDAKPVTFGALFSLCRCMC